jgi:ribosome recycling factor
MDENKLRALMQSVLDRTSLDISTIRTGRATPALVEGIEVVVYGGTTRLRILELATVTVPDPQTIVIDPWDKTIIGEIRKGIEAANLGFNPSIDGQIIRISLAPITSEDRSRYVKLVSQRIEEGKVEIRKVRGEAMHEVKKAFEEKMITEDERFQKEKSIQDLTDEFVRKTEEIGDKKKQELLQV